MATLDDVRTVALALPDVLEVVQGHRGGASWRTKNGGFVWQRGPSAADLAKLAALGRGWPDGDVVGIRTDGLESKEVLLASLPDVLFTIPHFDGYPAVLVRLADIDVRLLEELITDAWLVKAPKALAKEWLAQHPPA